MSSINDTLGDIAKSIKKRKAARAAASRATALPQDALEWAVIILEDDAAFSDNETMEVIDMFMVDQEVVTHEGVCIFANSPHAYKSGDAPLGEAAGGISVEDCRLEGLP
jgi:hypothetical protein